MEGWCLTFSLPLCLCAPQPVVTLDRTLSFTFSKEGRHGVTLQASVGNTVLQDQMAVQVYGGLWTVMVTNLLLSNPQLSLNYFLAIEDYCNRITMAKLVVTL